MSGDTVPITTTVPPSDKVRFVPHDGPCLCHSHCYCQPGPTINGIAHKCCCMCGARQAWHTNYGDTYIKAWDAASDEALAKVEWLADNMPHLPSGEVAK
jgi:hypothetical protein